MASYKQAIDWIADNEDTSEIEVGANGLEDAVNLAPVTVSMVAGVWNKDLETVVKDVQKALKGRFKL